MIFADLLDALVERLRWDAYFAESVFPITVIGDAPIDWTTALDGALGSRGVAALISLRNVTVNDRGLAFVSVMADFHELPMVNSRLANAKSALFAAVKAMSLWGHDWTPDEDVWNKIEFQRLQLTQLQKETGIITWQLEHRISTNLSVLFSVLSSGGEVALVNEAGAPLIISPTEP